MKGSLPLLTVLLALPLAAARWSPCAADEAPAGDAGFQPLFHGDSLDGWQKVHQAGFSIRDGVLLCDGSGQRSAWLLSPETFENFVLRFQVRLPQYGSGGILLHAPRHGRMSAVGMLIHLSDDTPKGRPTFASTGGVVGVRPPSALVGRPHQWMDVTIVCDYPRLVVEVDGRTVQQLDVRRDRMLRYRRRSGRLGFEDRGRRAEYRRIRIRRLPDSERPWVPLFTGDTLAGWQPIEGDAAWRVENGTLIAESGRGYLASKRTYRDFELSAYIKTAPGSNGGIFCRFASLPSDRGFEIQIEDNPDSRNPTGSIYNHRRACCLPIRAGSWYPLHAIVRGSHATVCVNGVPVVESDTLPVDRAGHLAIQLHHNGSRIRIQGMKIKVLNAEATR